MLLMCLASCFATAIQIPGRNLYVQNGIEGQASRLFHTDGVGFHATAGGEQNASETESWLKMSGQSERGV